jgi:alpha-galactosidase
VGDDTSGKDWERTRRMGVNALAFRLPQHDALFAIDADCVGLTDRIPWPLNRQWLDLLSRSGTPLFVSLQPESLGAGQRAALRAALERAASPAPAGDPLDWMETTCPGRWRLNGQIREYDWSL